MSKVDFSVGGGTYMLPNNMNLNINKTKSFNNKILISESLYKLGLNNRVNAIAKQKTAIKPKQKTAKLKKLRPHDREAKISVQNHNDEKIALSLLMTGTALVYTIFDKLLDVIMLFGMIRKMIHSCVFAICRHVLRKCAGC